MLEIKSYQEFLNVIHNNPGKFILVDFYAPWCKPCLKIMPEIEKLEKGITLSNIHFIKVNIDENCECTDNCNISSIPKFNLYLNGEEVDCVCGANVQAVGQMLITNIQKNNKNNKK